MLLELFRNHKRWLMFIAMILVIPSFVVTGIYSYNRMISDDGAIAKVDDVSILPQQFDEAKRQQLEILRERLGDAFRSNMLESREARVALLERMMNDRAVAGETSLESVEVSEETAIELIKTMPAFQQDGKFNPQAYQNFLTSRGYSDEYFVSIMRGDIARELLTSGLTRSVIAPKTASRNLYNLLNEKREIAVHTVPSADFVKSIQISDEDARKFWTDNQKLFERPDEIDVEYVVLTPALFANVQPTEENVKSFYEQNPNRFRAPEERRARGLRYVPEQRLGHGSVPEFSLLTNTLLTADNLHRRGFIDRDGARRFTEEIIRSFDVKTPSVQKAAQALSGGNLQKFIVGREILQHPKILIVDQPTWGVDVGAATVIRNALVELRSHGAAIVVVSEEIDELYEISDRIAVMYRGNMSPAVPVESLSMEELGRWMAGLWTGSPFKHQAREAD